MRGFSSLYCLLLFGVTCIKCDEDDNSETFSLEEPRGFFSRLDSKILGDKSIWNVKDTYMRKRNNIPLENIESDLQKKLGNSDDPSSSLVVDVKRSYIPLGDEFDESNINLETNPSNTIEPDDSDSSGSGADTRSEIGDLKNADGDVSQGDTSSIDIDAEADADGSSDDLSGSGIEGASIEGSGVNIIESAKLVHQDEVNSSIVISDVTKRDLIPGGKHLKRQFISHPRFVVKNGYVYMKAPPMTQKTIVTTHIPRPPLMMSYNNFVHSYRRGGNYGLGRRSHYMVPESRFAENQEETFEDERPDDSHCDGDPCMNGATCNEVRDGYECICPTGFKGTDCEEEDKCHPNPCHNAGVCTEANGQYVCTCAEGYKGTNCQETNHCQPNPCHNGATCNEVSNDYECICPVEFMGRDCSELNHCHLTPCLNGGTCTSNFGGASYGNLVNCLCPGGFSGGRCEVRDRCHVNPCKNGGACHDGMCTCIAGYAGEVCETPPSPCSLATCLNGGTCIAKGLNNYKCVCRHGFRGSNCEDESRCEPNPCLNNAVCIDKDDSYKCDCGHGFKGIHCEDEVSACDANPCLNEGTCLVEYTKFKCLCKPGYKGNNCEAVDRCHTHPCKNGGTCTVTDDDLHCLCPAGFKGALCDYVDHCTPNPCQNAGVCYANADSFTCQCNGGYKGLHCTDRDPCLVNPCHHEGICIPEGSTYRCECATGWNGKDCVTEDKCHPSPCLHGGVCVSRSPSDYECHCPSGFAGINCEVEGFPGVEHHHYEDHIPVLPPSCRNTHYGCCPDGENAATGPNGVGCPELHHEELPPHETLAISHENLHHEAAPLHEEVHQEFDHPHQDVQDWGERRSAHKYWGTPDRGYW